MALMSADDAPVAQYASKGMGNHLASSRSLMYLTSNPLAKDRTRCSVAQSGFSSRVVSQHHGSSGCNVGGSDERSSTSTNTPLELPTQNPVSHAMVLQSMR
jgi:hypothetical protein